MSREYLYRYDAASIELGYSPTLYRFEIIKTTPKGVWVSMWWGFGKKWVSSSGRKRYAYPTEKEAAESYVIRKMRYVENCRNDLERAERQYAAIRIHEEFEQVLETISHCDECLNRKIGFPD